MKETNSLKHIRSLTIQGSKALVTDSGGLPYERMNSWPVGGGAGVTGEVGVGISFNKQKGFALGFYAEGGIESYVGGAATIVIYTDTKVISVKENLTNAWNKIRGAGKWGIARSSDIISELLPPPEPEGH